MNRHIKTLDGGCFISFGDYHSTCRKLLKAETKSKISITYWPTLMLCIVYSFFKMYIHCNVDENSPKSTKSRQKCQEITSARIVSSWHLSPLMMWYSFKKKDQSGCICGQTWPKIAEDNRVLPNVILVLVLIQAKLYIVPAWSKHS